MSSPQNREEELFQAAVQLTGAERAAFLNGACLGDSALRQKLDVLLAAHDAPDVLPSKPAPAARATMKIEISDPPDEAVGQMLGRYKLMERLGEGGCGVVYVAEQTAPVRRRVALKVIKLGMDTKQVVARFEAERQALAMMDHPNIAKVLDAGTTDLGRPYFVMELVRGIRITDYCDQNQLSTKERLELFIKICQAIQHAHQKGIIHRDIKPSNILVTLHDGVPVPKVIDFGIAKATEGRLTDATVYTQLHQFIGTPAYMSPEQAEMSGLDIDTRSDIYSLGVLLYELLAGSTPFDATELMASGIDQMRKTIREKEPVRPSTRFATLKGEELTATARRRSADGAKLMHQLKGDLDWIVMKCLEKDRTRRYETANGIAADLRRHLNNEPIVARPPSTAYRLQKAIRRNKLVFAAGTAVGMALLLGIIASVSQVIRATRAQRQALAAQAQAVAAQAEEGRQRKQADAARGRAEGLVGFMLQDLQPALRDYGRLFLLKAVEQKAVDYFASLPPNLRNPETELAQADATGSLMEILAAQGDTKGAFQKGQEALALYQNLARQHPGIPEGSAGALNLEWALYMMEPGHPLADLDAFEQDVVRRWRVLLERFPTNRAVRDGFGSALGTRASLAAARFNKPQEAVATAQELCDKIKEGIALHSNDKMLARHYASSLVLLANALQAAGDHAKAVQFNEEAESFYSQALKNDSGNSTLLFESAQAAMNLSYCIAPDSLRKSYEAELRARERYGLLTSLDPANADWRHAFALSHMMECYYLENAGQLEAARQAFKKFDTLLSDAQLSAVDENKLFDNSSQLARLASEAGDRTDALAQLAVGQRRFQSLYNKLPAGSFDRTQAEIRWMNMKGSVLFSVRDWPALEGLAHQMLTAAADGLALRPDDSELRLRRAAAQCYLGIVLLHQDKAAEAAPLFQQALDGFDDTPAAIAFTDRRDTYTFRIRLALAESLAKTGDIDRAKNLAQSLISDEETELVKQPENRETQDSLANSLLVFAGILDATKPDQASHRESLLDRAGVILASAKAVGTLDVDEKEILSKLQSLRPATAH